MADISQFPGQHSPSSSRWKWISLTLGLVMLLSLGLGFLLRDRDEQEAVKAWQDFKSEWQAKGEDFSFTAWLPAPVADDENFAADPLVRTLMSAGQSDAAKAFDVMTAAMPEDYDYPDLGDSWFTAHTKEAEEFRTAVQPYAAILKELATAASRPKCRTPDDFFGTMNFPNERLAGLTKVKNPLAMHAEASLAVGDIPAAVSDLETLLRIGNHLRSQNSFMLHLMGTGMEKEAMARIEIALKAKQFSPEDRKRLLSACRTRTTLSELGTTMRYERGLFLSIFEKVRKTLPSEEPSRLNPFAETAEEIMATGKRAFCSTLQPALAANSEQGWRDLATALKSRARGSKAERLGTSGLLTYSQSINGTLDLDADFSAIRSKLAE